MVQLKEVVVPGLSTPNIISIPYGSIKRGRLYKHLLRYVKFQFLMVQLKEYHARNNRHGTGISIPYGSIKSKTRFRV